MKKRVGRVRSCVIGPLSPSQMFELKSDIQMWGISNLRNGRNNICTDMAFEECLGLVDDPETRKAISIISEDLDKCI